MMRSSLFARLSAAAIAATKSVVPTITPGMPNGRMAAVSEAHPVAATMLFPPTSISAQGFHAFTER